MKKREASFVKREAQKNVFTFHASRVDASRFYVLINLDRK